VPELEKRLTELEKMLGAAPPAPVPSWRDYLQDGEVENSPEGHAFGVLREVYRQALAELGEEEVEAAMWSAFVEVDFRLRHGEWGPDFLDDRGALAALERQYAQLARRLWEAGGES